MDILSQLPWIVFAAIISRLLRMYNGKENKKRAVKEELRSLWFTTIGIAVIWIPIHIIFEFFFGK